MIIIQAAMAFCGLGIGVFFLLLMADGRRLRERLVDRRPSFSPDEQEREALLIKSDHASWMPPPFGSVHPAGIHRQRSFYSVTPEPPGAD